MKVSCGRANSSISWGGLLRQFQPDHLGEGFLKKTDKAACYDKSSVHVVIQIKVLHSRVLHTLNERVQASLEHANYNGGMKIRPIEIFYYRLPSVHSVKINFGCDAQPNPDFEAQVTLEKTLHQQCRDTAQAKHWTDFYLIRCELFVPLLSPVCVGS